MVSQFLKACRRRKHIDGVALVEFILIMPLAIIICLGAIDLSRAIRTFKTASTLSREMANAAYRECVTSDRAEREACLLHAQNRIQNFANQLVDPNPAVAVTMFIWVPNPGENPLNGTGSVTTIAVNTNGTMAQAANGAAIPDNSGVKYTAPGQLPGVMGAALGQSIQDHQAIVVGEARLAFNPIVPVFFRYFLGNDVHEITIY